MFPLFELAKLISFGSQGDRQFSFRGQAAHSTFREVGGRSFLALFLSDNHLILWCQSFQNRPCLCVLPWYPDKPVLSMCYDPSGSWLLCATVHSRLVIVPAGSILDPQIPVDAVWPVNDTTELKLSKKRGVATCISWWQTLEGEHIAVIGTKLGFVVLVNLRSGRQIREVDVSEHITGIELVRDNSQSFTYALITTKSNSQWKLLLEQKVEPPPARQTPAEGSTHFEKSSTFSVGKVMNIANVSDEDSQEFQPLKFYQFSSSVMLSAQYAKGRHLVAAQDMKTNLYQVLDSSTNYAPLYVYRLPNWSEMSTVLADKLLFLTSKQEEDTVTATLEATPGVQAGTSVVEATLTVLAAQKTEVSGECFQSFNQESILHQFHLEPGEEVISIYKKTFPFNWHQRHSGVNGGLIPGGHDLESHDPLLQPASHTVLDGCMLLTTRAVYECRPSISPELLFLDLALASSTLAEKLGFMLALDIGSLFLQAAEYKLSKGTVRAACKLLQLAKCPPCKRVSLLIKYGRVAEVLTYIRQIFHTQRLELTVAVTAQLADTLLQCFVHQLLQKTKNSADLMVDFRGFLLQNNCYNCDRALDLLAKFGFVELLLQVARAKGRMSKALELLLQRGCVTLNSDLIQLISQTSASSGISKDSLRFLLSGLSAEDLLPVLQQQPQYVLDLLHELEVALPQLGVDDLLAVTSLLDISQPVLRPVWQRSLTFDRHSQGEERDQGVDAAEVFDIFIHAVILLNHRRMTPLDLDYLTESDSVEDVETPEESVKPPEPPRQCLGYRPLRVGCGTHHGMVVREGELYCWGRRDLGRLGCGSEALIATSVQCDPLRVDPLCGPGLRVLSVACGAEHTLALTNCGLYGWGQSKYGQVGCGDRGVRNTPTLLANPSSGHYVAAQCGEYHSMALTSEFRAYTWGWGVHGQLGQGHPEDVLLPTAVSALNSVQVVDIAAGYAHSVFCTDQGEVYACGNSMFGQLGLANREKVSLPQRVKALKEPVRAIATKYFHNLALTEDDKLYTWGSHPNLLRFAMTQARRARAGGPGGQGVMEQGDQCALRLVDTNLVNSKIVQICCGTLFNALLTKDGEVFTWGRNFAGQLGTGLRQDEKKPVMVVQINDVKVVDIATGPSHLVAMDTDGSVWGWGRNDEGQLCMKPQKPPQPSKSALQHPLKSQPFSVMVTPIRLMRAGKTQLKLQENSWWLYETEDVGQQPMMPDLRGSSTCPYPPSCLVQVIQCLPELFNPMAMLRRCLDIREWQCASVIARHLGLYGKALEYQLQALEYQLQALTQHLDATEEMMSRAVDISKYFLGKILEEGATDHRNATCEIALEKLVVFWHASDGSIGDLESLLLTFLSDLVYPFFLLQTRCISSQQQDGPHKKAATKCVSVFNRLSTNFQLAVTSTLLSQLAAGNIREQQLWSKLIGNNADETIADLDLKATEKLVSADKLWQGITDNLKKGAESKAAITISSQTLESLCRRPNQKDDVGLANTLLRKTSKNSSGTEVPAAESSAVLFTCGHQYARKAFLETVVPELENSMSQKAQSLPHTAALLKKYYHREGFYPMACPKCVLNAVKQL